MTVDLQKSATSVTPKRCVGCGHMIFDQFLLFALDGYWHCCCLTCSCCCVPLAQIGSSCFTRGGMILCRSDYIRLFGEGGVCRGCSSSIPAGEMAMKAKSYMFHMECFVCSICSKQLVPGDRFRCDSGTLFCDQDRPAAAKASERKPCSLRQVLGSPGHTSENVKAEHLLDR